MLADPGYHSFSHRHHAYVRRGQYAEQLARLRRFFPAEQIHVIESESFFEQPEDVFSRVLDFLTLPMVMPDSFDRWNGRPSAPMPTSTRARLRQHFASHDEALAIAPGTGTSMGCPDRPTRACPCGPTTPGSRGGTDTRWPWPWSSGCWPESRGHWRSRPAYSATASVVLAPVPVYVTSSTYELVAPEVSIDTDAQMLEQPASARRDRRDPPRGCRERRRAPRGHRLSEHPRAARHRVGVLPVSRRRSRQRSGRRARRGPRGQGWGHSVVTSDASCGCCSASTRTCWPGSSADDWSCRRSMSCSTRSSRSVPASSELRDARQTARRGAPRRPYLLTQSDYSNAEVPVTSGALLGLIAGCLFGAGRDRARQLRSTGQHATRLPPSGRRRRASQPVHEEYDHAI